MNMNLFLSLSMGLRLNSITSVYTDRNFGFAFSMTKHNVNVLYEVLANDLERNAKIGKRSRGTTISGRIGLEGRIRMFAGALYL